MDDDQNDGEIDNAHVVQDELQLHVVSSKEHFEKSDQSSSVSPVEKDDQVLDQVE